MTIMLPMEPRSRAVMNLGHFLTQTARRLPERPALMRGDTVMTWRRMNARADALAHALVARGVGKHDRVLVHSPNHPDMAVAMYAIWKTGAVLVPTNFRLGPAEIAAMARATGARVAIGHARHEAHVTALRDTGIADDALLTIDGTLNAAIGAHEQAGTFAEAAVERDDPAWFFFTSGTTGAPKIAVLTHGQLAFVLNNHAADLMPGLCEDDVSLAIAPLSHGAGLHFFVQVARGAPTVLTASEGLDTQEVFALIARHRVTNLFAVPTIVKRLVEDPDCGRHDLSSLRHLVYAGAPMYRADQKRALEKLGPCLVQYYGLGEVTGAITVLPVADHHLDDDAMRTGTCGRARMGMEIAILTESGEPLAAGATGNIAVRGPAVFAGYLDNEAANRDAFRNGWFVTGDVGHMDEAGYLFITGRRSDMYISGGSNIYPREIEEVLLEHPGVEEVAIVGVPDARWGEAGAAVIVPRSGIDLRRDEVIAFLAPRVARYKLPAHVILTDMLPKSGYGKVEKKTVRAMLEQGPLADVFAAAGR